MCSANPFTQPGIWFRGNLHAHSRISDGTRGPEAVIAWYRSQGYHFLALTDHNALSREELSRTGDFLLLSGIEIDGIDPLKGLYHLVGLGLRGLLNPNLMKDIPAQEAINLLRAAGGLVFLAHPYWSGQMSRDLLDLEGCFGVEIYNGSCEAVCGKGFSTVHWDDLLARGRRLWGLAVDDSHWFPGHVDVGLGWVWVKAAALTREAILAALEQGCFYASSGPQIHELRLEGDRVQVRCSPAAVVDFIGNGHHAQRVTAASGETLTDVTRRLDDDQCYVRVACCDLQGRWAWSNPLFLDAR